MKDQKKKQTWPKSLPPIDIVLTGDSFVDVVPRLGELDADEVSSYGQRLRVYGSMRRVWRIFLFWFILLAIALTQAKVRERDIRIDAFFNTTLFPNLEQHWERINRSVRLSNYGDESKRPGTQLAQKGATPKYPVVMIPGFVTSGLELWEGEECAKKYFRQRMWGALGTARTFLTERDCYLRHMSLDHRTGGDPENIRLRPAQGFEAADYFMTAYWVWNKLIENLAAIGYDGSTMSLESYDWRLPFPLLEQRDGYFTNLRHRIEAMHKFKGEKVVVAAHSMGGLVLTYFFAWVTTPVEEGGGGGGENWVDEHVHSFVNLAGTMMGVPKSVTSIMSGEMKNTNMAMGTLGSMVEQFFGRRLRKGIWSSWGSLWGMLPKGGDEIWAVGADICEEGKTFDGIRCIDAASLGSENPPKAAFVEFVDAQEGERNTHCRVAPNDKARSPLDHKIAEFSAAKTRTIDDTIGFLAEWGAGLGSAHASTRLYSFDKHERHSPRTWHDPSRTPLPHAPNMKIYCLYGVGIETERAFYYRKNNEQQDGDRSECPAYPTDLPFVMAAEVEDLSQNIAYGVKTSDGDGSVPLLSLGYMCVDGWKKDHLNPSKSAVTTREYPHRHHFSVDDPMRGGPLSADHVDILGNVEMLEDFLRIVSDFDSEKVDTRIESDIVNIAARINSHPLGGLKDHTPQKTTNVLWGWTSKLLPKRKNQQRTRPS